MSWFAFGRALQGGQAAYEDALDRKRRDAAMEEEKLRYSQEQAYRQSRDQVGDQRYAESLTRDDQRYADEQAYRTRQESLGRAGRAFDVAQTTGGAVTDPQDLAAMQSAGYAPGLDIRQQTVSPAAGTLEAMDVGGPSMLPAQSVDAEATVRVSPEVAAQRAALERKQAMEAEIAGMDPASPTFERDLWHVAARYGQVQAQNPTDLALDRERAQAQIAAQRATAGAASANAAFDNARRGLLPTKEEAARERIEDSINDLVARQMAIMASGDDKAMTPAEILQFMNIQRAANGLPPLAEIPPALAQAAAGVPAAGAPDAPQRPLTARERAMAQYNR